MLQGFEIKFNIYAENEQEADEARNAIISFINAHAKHGRAVTGRKIADAVKMWDKNPFIKSKIIDFFK